MILSFIETLVKATYNYCLIVPCSLNVHFEKYTHNQMCTILNTKNAMNNEKFPFQYQKIENV